MTTAWPATVNSVVLKDGYGEQRETNLISFKPEGGRPIRRRRNSQSDYLIPVTMWMTSDELDAFDYFYHQTLFDGLERFTWIHPRTGLAATFQFENEAPKIVQVLGLSYVVQFQIRLISGGLTLAALKFNRISSSQYLGAL